MKTKCLLFFVTLFITLLASCSVEPDINDANMGDTTTGGDNPPRILSTKHDRVKFVNTESESEKLVDTLSTTDEFNQ